MIFEKGRRVRLMQVPTDFLRTTVPMVGTVGTLVEVGDEGFWVKFPKGWRQSIQGDYHVFE